MSVSVRASRIPASLIMLLGALTAIGPFTIDLYLAAFPQITADLTTDPAAVQLTITATLAGLALGQLVIGSVSDAITTVSVDNASSTDTGMPSQLVQCT